MMNLSPPIRKVSAKTIGANLISVVPMGSTTGRDSEIKRIISETTKINRDLKIDCILNDREYREVTIEEHPDYYPYHIPNPFQGAKINKI